MQHLCCNTCVAHKIFIFISECYLMVKPLGDVIRETDKIVATSCLPKGIERKNVCDCS
jgi:hypothetical protein